MEWIFRTGYLFILIWAFGLSTNGLKRNQIILFGGLGSICTLILSIIVSVVSRSLLFLGVLIEMTVLLFFLLILFGWIFRKIPKPINNGKYYGKSAEEIIQELRKN